MEKRKIEGNMFFIKILKYLTFAVICFYACTSFGTQKINVSDRDVIKIKLSSRELTRVAVENGRIDKIWGATGILETQVDKKEGELFLRPSSSAANAFSFFVRDSYGSTYTIVAEQFDIPSQTVILVPTNRVSKVDKEKYKNRGLVLKIKDLVKIMANPNFASDKIQLQEHNEEIELWKESKIVLVKTYQLDKLKGETFRFKNISKKEMQLAENEFLNFRSNVLAVAIEKLTLRPEEEANLYIVRRDD